MSKKANKLVVELVIMSRELLKDIDSQAKSIDKYKKKVLKLEKRILELEKPIAVDEKIELGENQTIDSLMEKGIDFENLIIDHGFWVYFKDPKKMRVLCGIRTKDGHKHGSSVLEDQHIYGQGYVFLLDDRDNLYHFEEVDKLVHVRNGKETVYQF